VIRTGLLVILLGLAIGVLGTLQYNYVLAYSQEPPEGSQILMWISWGIAGALLVGGGMELISGMAGSRKQR
jgi:hypothetical protein